MRKQCLEKSLATLVNIAKSGRSLGRKQFPLSPKTLQSYKNNIVANLEDVE